MIGCENKRELAVNCGSACVFIIKNIKTGVISAARKRYRSIDSFCDVLIGKHKDILTSGVGKSTILEQLMKNRSDLLFSVSATTRKPRPQEREGISYYFVTREQFREMISRDAFVEYDNHMEQ